MAIDALASVTPIGFGAFKIGRNVGIKYPSGYELPDEATASRLLNNVLDLGINYIDTAPAYGLSEERIGRAIAHRRAEYVLATKVGETFEGGASTYDFSAGAIRSSVRRSLERLRTDRLDLVLIHSPRDDLRVLQSTDAVSVLQELRSEGLIRWIGFSGYTGQAFGAAIEWADAIMATYHPGDTTLTPVLDEALRRGVAVIVKKGLASGRLDAEAAIRFVLSNPSVTTMPIGTLNVDHLRRNLEVAYEVRGMRRHGA
jgi:aryl-alcohol dehydrogenase-like predicted oxidoreductase